ncbi:MAG: 6-carboxytetrahydropterin synthase QueD [Candidatus Omnitrophica bacterium]|nr:6-carboxytetrahydropterin synthase QueD [Candidatus Omnitrophota bacterium]
MFKVIRQIHFSYGHRLVGHAGKCANLHGHNARVEIELSSEKLDKLGMVMDFYEIRKAIGSWIDETLDHKMILAEKDPLVPLLQKEKEPLVLTQENPTAEVLARMIFEEARKRRLPVSKVTLWETENSAAEYHES